ncbi:MAG: NFACT family protein, partial [Tissierellaceae bacterium]
MSYDGIVTKAVVKELRENLIGGRIDKVYQQEKDEILIHVHNKGTNYKLIMSSSSNNPRVYLTEYKKTNPPEPPMFCMLLRKHLIGGLVLNIEQFELDRVILLDVSAFDEFGQPSEKRLIVEIMGKHSNIILIDKKDLKIIDSVKRVYEDMSRIRQVLPGMHYSFPPLQNKINPLNSPRERFLDLIDSADKNLPIFKFFYFNYMGLSPLISREICFNSNIDIYRTIGSLYEKDIDDLYYAFDDLMAKIRNEAFKANYILDTRSLEIRAFHVMDINQFGQENKYFSESISLTLNNFYERKDIADRVNQKSQSIRKAIQVRLDRTLNKLAKQKEELDESRDRKKYKVYADLVSANLHRIPRGIDHATLENFYDENLTSLRIPLDIRLSPAQNAQKYYKRYSKLKNAYLLLMKQIPETEFEASYLENILFSIENSTEIEELEEIKEELVKENYIKANLKKKRRET